MTRTARTCRARRILALVIALGAATPAGAQPPLETLTLVVPAAPGGGWDQTARALQQVLQQEGLVRIVVVQNVPGAGGTIGLSQFVRGRRGDGDALLVTGLVMVGATLWNDSPVSLDQATPIARLTGEYEVIAVPADSPIALGHAGARRRTARLAPRRSLGRRIRGRHRSHPCGADRRRGRRRSAAGQLRRVLRRRRSGGGAALGGHVAVGVSGYGEFAAHIDVGTASARWRSRRRRRVPDLAVPTLREQRPRRRAGELAGLLAPPGIADADRAGNRPIVIDAQVQTTTVARRFSRREWLDLYLDGAAVRRVAG